MCGIVTAFSTQKDVESVNEAVLDQFEDQKDRGTEGFGIINIGDDKKISTYRACESAKFVFDIMMHPAKMIIAHHRHPTSTPNWLGQTHPLFISNPALEFDYFVVHNGVIGNSDELMKIHEKEINAQYRTFYVTSANIEKFNDSESMAYEVALYIEGIQKTMRFSGSAAFVAIQADKKTGKALQVFYGRNDRNPLKLAASRGWKMISSEGPGNDIKADVLYSFKPDGDMRVTSRPLSITPLVKEYKWEKSHSAYGGNGYGNKTVEGFSQTKTKDTVGPDNNLVKGITEVKQPEDWSAPTEEDFDESDTFTGEHARQFQDIYEDTEAEAQSILLDFFEMAQAPETIGGADPRSHAERFYELFKEAGRKMQEIHDADDMDAMYQARIEEEGELPFPNEDMMDEEETSITTPTVFRERAI